MMAKIDLASHFEPLSARQWRERIQYDLKGEDYTETLVWESPDGIKVKPFYSAEDLELGMPLPRHKAISWKICQEIKVADAGSANVQAKHALDNGAEALQFLLASEVEAGRLLAGIDTARIPVHFRFGFMPSGFIPSLLKVLPESPAGVFLHLDIIGHLVRKGNWFAKQEADFANFRKLLPIAGSNNIHLPGVDGRIYHNAGATVVQQLAYCLAHAHEYVHAFEGELKQAPVFTLAIGPEYFFEIAKFRALRSLWASLAAEYDLPPQCHIVAVPGMRNKTIYDYNTNILRTASECMSAILGNSDTLINLPYDVLYRKPNEFSTRLARNQLLILRHESRFNEVATAADGAYYIETITRQLAEKSLGLFKQMEAGGGFLKQLREHKIQKKLSESAANEQKQFDKGEKILLGANKLRQSTEKMKAYLEFTPFGQTKPGKTEIEPLSGKRLAAGLEKKRLEDE